ncbi:mannose-6-phosphate isomerase [Brevibacterium pityocampae]
MQKLTNTVRDYPWGSPTGIPEILGREPDGTPAAELWIGAHPGAPSGVEDTDLREWIARDPHTRLGAGSVDVYGERLPFLLKILSARTALSIQAHPSREQAQAGYAREDAAGVPVDAPHRNYRDTWHKPELIHALGDFDALCGFRPLPAIRATVERLRAAASPADRPLLEAWLTALTPSGGQDDEAAALREATDLVLGRAAEYGPLADRLAALDLPGVGADHPCRQGSAVDPQDTLREVTADFPGDAGTLVALMLRRLRLRAGESLALDAGVLHAYLGGLGVEIMASSDNVLRGGLTSKHIDLAELDAVVVYDSVEPQRAAPDARGVVRGATDDFALQRIDSAADLPIARSGAAILLCTAGGFTVRSGEESTELAGGDSVFVGADEPLPHVTGTGQLFVATTGLPAPA